MIPKEVLQKIRRIEVTTSRLVSDVFAGQYQSVFKGRGMEFDEVREYQPGDEIRSIDWNVTARMGHPYIKKFVEERELTLMLLLDMSASCSFGTVRQLKSQLAAELCALLALSAVKNNDKAGLIIFTDRIEKFIPPRKGLRHALRIIREGLYFKPKGKGTDIPLALEYLSRVTTRKTVSFMISDFYTASAAEAPLEKNSPFRKALNVANKRHDLVAMTITDPRELELPNIGIIRLEDAETGKDFLVDSSDSSARDSYRSNSHARLQQRKKLFASINMDCVDIRTDTPYDKSLYAFFKMRERRMR